MGRVSECANAPHALRHPCRWHGARTNGDGNSARGQLHRSAECTGSLTLPVLGVDRPVDAAAAESLPDGARCATLLRANNTRLRRRITSVCPLLSLRLLFVWLFVAVFRDWSGRSGWEAPSSSFRCPSAAPSGSAFPSSSSFPVLLPALGAPPPSPLPLDLTLLLSFDGNATSAAMRARAVAALMAARHVATGNDSVLPLAAELALYVRPVLHLADSRSVASVAMQAVLQVDSAGVGGGGGTGIGSGVGATNGTGGGRIAVLGIVGDALSAMCVPASMAAASVSPPIPMVSPSCTAAQLSDKATHASFARLVPSDAAQGMLLARLVTLFGWQRVALLFTPDLYGRSVAQAVGAALQAAGVYVAQHLVDQAGATGAGQEGASPSPSTSTTTDTALGRVQSSGIRVVLVCMVTVGTELIDRARDRNMLADTVFLSSDSLIAHDLVGSAAEGLLGVQPLVQTDRPPYRRFLQAWAAQRVDDFPAALNLPPDYFASPPASTYVAHIYDCVIAFALAAQRAIDGGEALGRVSLLRALQSKNPAFAFDGVSRGAIRFNAEMDLTPMYSVLNLQRSGTATGAPLAMRTVAEVAVQDDGSIDAASQAQILRDVRFYSGSNAPPLDRNASLLVGVTLLVTHAVGSRPLPVTAAGAECTHLYVDGHPPPANAASCSGGAARRVAFFQRSRAEAAAAGESVLAVDLGASYYPSAYYRVDQGATVARWISAHQYDVMGVHTDDLVLGPQAAAKYFRLLQPACSIDTLSMGSGSASAVGEGGHCVVATTLVATADSQLRPLFLPFVVKRVATAANVQLLVGFLSLQRDDFTTATSGGNDLTLAPAQIDVVRRQAQYLNQTLGCALVVLLTSSYNNLSPATFVPQLSGVQAVLTVAPVATAPYMLLDKARQTVRVVAVLASGNVNRLRLLLDEGGRLVHAALDAVQLTANATHDPVVHAEMATAAAQVQRLMAQQIGAVPERLHTEIGSLAGRALGASAAAANWTADQSGFVFPVASAGCRVSQCSSGSLLADLMLRRWPAAVVAQAAVAHINAGTLRGPSIPAGNLTMRHAHELLPYNNALVLLELTGEQILQRVVERSLLLIGGGGYQQFAGLRFGYSIGADGRVDITHASVANAGGDHEPLDRTRVYTVVTSQYMLDGGDGYSIAAVARNIRRTADQLVDLLVDTLQSGDLAAALPMHNSTAVEPCWRRSWTLSADPQGRTVWPLAACRWLTTNQASTVQRCPTGEVEVKRNRTAGGAAADSDSAFTAARDCVCSPSYSRSAVYQNGVRPCQPCTAAESKTLAGDHPCACGSSFYLLPNFLHGKPFRCIDPTGLTRYNDPPASGEKCRQCPSQCMGCYLWNERNASRNADRAEDFDAWAANWWLLPGWWWDGRSEGIYKCPAGAQQDGKCKGTFSNTRMCAEGFTGPLCAQCEAGFGGFKHGSCTRCDSASLSVAFLSLSVVCVAALLLILLYTSFVPKQRSSDVVKVLVRHAQLISFLGAIRVSDGDIIRSFSTMAGMANTAGAKTLAYSCVFRLNAIQHLQVSTLLLAILLGLFVLSLVIRQVRLKCFASADEDLALKVVRPGVFLRTLFCCCVPARCLPDDEHVHQLDLLQLSPAMRQRLRDSLHSGANIRMKRWAFEQALTPACVILLNFFLPALMLESLAMMKPCLRIADRRLMADDTSVDCDSDEFKVWQAVALVRVIALGVVVPAAIFTRLYVFHRAIAREKSANAAAHAAAPKPMQSAKRTQRSPGSVPLNPIREREARSFFLRYRFLFESYQESAYWWEIVYSARYSAIALVVVFVGQDDLTQVAAAALVLLAAYLLHTWKRPFRDFQVQAATRSQRKSMVQINKQQRRMDAVADADPQGQGQGQAGAVPRRRAGGLSPKGRTPQLLPTTPEHLALTAEPDLQLAPRSPSLPPHKLQRQSTLFSISSGRLTALSLVAEGRDGSAGHSASPSLGPGSVGAASRVTVTVPPPLQRSNTSNRSGLLQSLPQYLSLNTLESTSLILLIFSLVLSAVSHADPWKEHQEGTQLRFIGDSSEVSVTGEAANFHGQLAADSQSSSGVRRAEPSDPARALEWLVVLMHLSFLCYVAWHEATHVYRFARGLYRRSQIAARRTKQAAEIMLNKMKAKNDDGDAWTPAKAPDAGGQPNAIVKVHSPSSRSADAAQGLSPSSVSFDLQCDRDHAASVQQRRLHEQQLSGSAQVAPAADVPGAIGAAASSSNRARPPPSPLLLPARQQPGGLSPASPPNGPEQPQQPSGSRGRTGRGHSSFAPRSFHISRGGARPSPSAAADCGAQPDGTVSGVLGPPSSSHGPGSNGTGSTAAGDSGSPLLNGRMVAPNPSESPLGLATQQPPLASALVAAPAGHLAAADAVPAAAAAAPLKLDGLLAHLRTEFARNKRVGIRRQQQRQRSVTPAPAPAPEPQHESDAAGAHDSDIPSGSFSFE